MLRLSGVATYDQLEAALHDCLELVLPAVVSFHLAAYFNDAILCSHGAQCTECVAKVN